MKSVVFLLFALLTSCVFGGDANPPGIYAESRGDNYSRDPRLDVTPRREIPKRPDPVKQDFCKRLRGASNSCGEDSSCQDKCDDLFGRRASKKECYDHTIAMVDEFEELLDFVEDGEVDEIDPEVLECYLDIEEDKEFIDAIKKMSSSEAKEFLVAIADDEQLAGIMESEDDERIALRQIFREAIRSDDLDKILEEKIDDGQSFLWLAGAGNEEAWDYLDDYVNRECDKSSNDCPGREPISAYCSALIKLSDNKLEDFLTDADYFAEEYEEDVEDEDLNRDYDEDGFRAYCQTKTAGECPDEGDELGSDYFIAEVDFSSGTTKKYVSQPYCHSTNNGDTQMSKSTEGDDKGSNQDIILSLNDWGSSKGELFLNEDELKDDYDNDYKYFLYVDNDRYEIRSPEDYEENNSRCSVSDRRDILYFKDFLGSDTFGSGYHKLFLARENKSGNIKTCEPLD